MEFLMIWIAIHKNALYGVCALGLWAFAQYWYFRGDIRRIRAQRRPQRWEVDMNTKTVTRGRGAMH